MGRLNKEVIGKIALNEQEKIKLGQLCGDAGYKNFKRETKFIQTRVKPLDYLNLVEANPKFDSSDFFAWLKFNYPNIYFKLVQSFFVAKVGK
jgi:hypothetical protein